MMTQISGSLPVMRDIQMELMASASPSASCCGHWRSEPIHGITLSFIVTLPFKYIKMISIKDGCIPQCSAQVLVLALVQESNFLQMQTLGSSSDGSNNRVLATYEINPDLVPGSQPQPSPIAAVRGIGKHYLSIYLSKLETNKGENRLLIFPTAWMNLSVTASVRKKAERSIYCMIPFIFSSEV